MRTHHSPDLTVLRAEVATRLGLAEEADDAAFEQECREYLSDLRWPGGVECPRCSENDAPAVADAPLEVALLLVPLPVQRHRRHALPQLAPAGLEVVRRRPPDARRRPTASRPTSSAGRSAAATRPPGSRRTGSGPRCAGHGAELLADLVDAELGGGRLLAAGRMPSSPARTARCSRGCGGCVGGPHHQLSVKYLPAYIDERRWRSVNKTNPHVFRDTIQALLEGEGISYDRLVSAV